MMQSYFHSIYFNVILPSVSRFYKHSLSYRFPYHSPACISLLLVYYMYVFHLSHPQQF